MSRPSTAWGGGVGGGVGGGAGSGAGDGAGMGWRMPAAIFAGGFIGTVARAELAQALPAGRDAWPWATLVVNVLGAFLVGMVATHVRAGGRRATLLGPLLGTGLCGALTTFSALQLELLGLLEEGESARAITYISVSLVAGLAAVAAGTAVVRRA